MFDHSIKVPRLYKTAAQIYKHVQEGKGSVKQLLYQKKHPNIKAIYALVVETFQKQNELNDLLKRTQLLIKETRLDPNLARILVTELLWGKKRLAGESKPVKTVLAYEQKFKAHLSDVEAKCNSTHEDKTSTNQVQKPRYVRINTLEMSTNEAVESFRDDEWNLVRYTDTNNYEGFLNIASSLEPDDFMVDIHIPNLLLFHPKTQFYQHTAYKNGKIILQDKASCIPVHLLNPPPGSTVLDMCAAPGMKTTQLAALLNNDGLIYAVEVNNSRYQTLNKMVNLAGASCVQTLNKDVLTLTDQDCPNVEYILVDPSCSGSGMDRLEFENNQSDNIENRLSKLASFQIKILRYALTRFPKAKRVVYSTCSINTEENEDVVRQVLETCTTFKLVPAIQSLKNSWINFGSPNYGLIGPYCLYAKPEVDLTNGFFVAIFERLSEGEENQFLNKNMYDKPKKIRKNKTYTKDCNIQQNYDEFQNNDNDNIENDLQYEENDINKSKKKKTRKSSNIEIDIVESEINLQQNDEVNDNNVLNEENNIKSKKKKKQRSNSNEIETTEKAICSNLNAVNKKGKLKKQKNKKSDSEIIIDNNINEVVENIVEETHNKKRRKKMLESQENVEVEYLPKKKKKHKAIKNDSILDTELETNIIVDLVDDVKRKHKKKNKKKILDEPTEENDISSIEEPLKIKIKKSKTIE